MAKNKINKDELLTKDEAEQTKECPECHGLMHPVIDTQYAMTGDKDNDDTHLVEYWECADCEYFEVA